MKKNLRKNKLSGFSKNTRAEKEQRTLSGRMAFPNKRFTAGKEKYEKRGMPNREISKANERWSMDFVSGKTRFG